MPDQVSEPKKELIIGNSVINKATSILKSLNDPKFLQEAIIEAKDLNDSLTARIAELEADRTAVLAEIKEEIKSFYHMTIQVKDILSIVAKYEGE